MHKAREQWRIVYLVANIMVGSTSSYTKHCSHFPVPSYQTKVYFFDQSRPYGQEIAIDKRIKVCPTFFFSFLFLYLNPPSSPSTKSCDSSHLSTRQRTNTRAYTHAHTSSTVVIFPPQSTSHESHPIHHSRPRYRTRRCSTMPNQGGLPQ